MIAHGLREHRAILALVLAFLVVGSIYAIVTPIFEAGDELWHYPYVQSLAQGNGLPVQDPAQKQLWEQEGGQPPLYYAAAAVSTFWVDTSDLETRLWRNPYARIGIPLAYGNKNLIVHTAAESFPWRDTTLAVHIVRFLSLLFSAGTVALTFFIAQELISGSSPFPDYLPLIAAVFVAFNPMFLFISASVNNDSLAALLATAALWACVRLARRGATTSRFLALGVVVGFAALTKSSNLALIGLALIVIAWLAYKSHDWRLFLRGFALVVIPVLVIAGWWYARNYLLYGDPLAFNVWLKIAGGRPTQSLIGLLDEFQGFRISFWGNFGGVNVIAPDWVYLVFDAITILAVIGLIIGFWRKELPPLLWIPILWLALVFIALIRWTLLTYASQGRLIFPAIASVGILLAFGLDALGKAGSLLLPHRILSARALRLLVPVVAVIPVALFAVIAPFSLIAPAYAQPLREPSATNVPNPVLVTYAASGAGPKLLGYEAGKTVRPGGELPLTLYWQTAEPIPEDLYVYIHLYDAQGDSIGQWDALPGNGLYPTRVWQPGEILVDHYRIPVSSSAAPFQIGRVEVGLAPVGSTQPLSARDPSGTVITPTIARFKIAGLGAIDAPEPTLWNLGDTFDLTRLDFDGIRGTEEFPILPTTQLKTGDSIKVNYGLRATRGELDDYIVYIHLVNASGEIIAQSDLMPRKGTYPTSVWDAGESVSDQIELAIPSDITPGDYSLEFGIYEAMDGTRLAVEGNDHANIRAAGDHLMQSPIKIAE